jgi:hypothetical protein
MPERIDKSCLRNYLSPMNINRLILDIGEDRRRLSAFRQTRAAIPLDEVKAWVESWGSTNELPRPVARETGDAHFAPRR